MYCQMVERYEPPYGISCWLNSLQSEPWLLPTFSTSFHHLLESPHAIEALEAGPHGDVYCAYVCTLPVASANIQLKTMG